MSKKRISDKINRRELLVLALLALLVLAFGILSPTFRTYPTLVAVLDCSYYAALMAIGVTFPLLTGGVDLSIGTGLVCYSLIGGYLIVHKGMPVGAAIAVTLLAGTLIGFFNGILVAVMELPPFLATLCSCMITRGLGSALCGGFSVSWPSALSSEGAFRKIFKFTSASGRVVPVGIVLILVLVIVMTFVLNHTKFGRYAVAIGSNAEAAKLAGVSVRRYHILAYVVCRFFAGMAGVAYAATYPTLIPGSGAGFELEAIGGAIVGGVSADGGSGTIFGAFLGVLVVSLLKVGLPYIGLQTDWTQIFTGLILLAVVMIDAVKKVKKI